MKPAEEWFDEKEPLYLVTGNRQRVMLTADEIRAIQADALESAAVLCEKRAVNDRETPYESGWYRGLMLTARYIRALQPADAAGVTVGDETSQKVFDKDGVTLIERPIEQRSPEDSAAIDRLKSEVRSLLNRKREIEAQPQQPTEPDARDRVVEAARELMPFMPPGYHGVPLANLRHALAALDATPPEPPGCRAGSDGDCNWKQCPQTRDGEPEKSGRDCPLWVRDDEV